MTRATLCLLFLLTTGTCIAADTEADFYVSVDGSDRWSGRLAQPNAQKSDGPFETLERARDAVRDLKKLKGTDIVVLVREGTYELSDTVVFGLEDSADGKSTITYADYPGETSAFSSGQKNQRWGKMTGERPGSNRLADDPMMVDPENGNFRFRLGSPALAMGLKLLDVLNMGLVADASRPPDHYPQFSWDSVPMYMHMRKSDKFSQEELEYLASFPIITLEKTTGSAAYGSTEKGSRMAAKAIKAVNPDACVLYYRNVMCNYGTYQVNERLKEIPGAFLIGRDGNKRLHRGRREVYDLSNPALRKWWVDHCVEMAEHDEIDGIFLDGNIKALEPAFLRQEIGRERKQEVAEGYALMMQDLRSRTPSDSLLVANIIRARLPDSGLDYLQHFDGSYLEGIESEANGLTRMEYLAKGIAAIQRAARDGKIICMSMGLGKAALGGLKIDDSRKRLARGANVQPRLQYCLAMFLICAEKYSYFLPHDGYSVNNNDSSVWLTRFAEFDKPLGPPKGPAVRNGSIYTREFEHASVYLDIEKQQGRVTWK